MKANGEKGLKQQSSLETEESEESIKVKNLKLFTKKTSFKMNGRESRQKVNIILN
jgi:hypothetical protein